MRAGTCIMMHEGQFRSFRSKQGEGVVGSLPSGDPDLIHYSGDCPPCMMLTALSLRPSTAYGNLLDYSSIRSQWGWVHDKHCKTPPANFASSKYRVVESESLLYQHIQPNSRPLCTTQYNHDHCATPCESKQQHGSQVHKH